MISYPLAYAACHKTKDPWPLTLGTFPLENREIHPPRHRKSQQYKRLQRSRVRNSVFHLILPCPHSHQPFKKVVLHCSSGGCPGVCSEFMQYWHMAFFLPSLYINYSEMYFISRLVHQHSFTHGLCPTQGQVLSKNPSSFECIFSNFRHHS